MSSGHSALQSPCPLTPKADMQCTRRCPLCANSGHSRMTCGTQKDRPVSQKLNSVLIRPALNSLVGAKLPYRFKPARAPNFTPIH